MSTIYDRYMKLNVDSSRVGLERGESVSSYFCTPKGAKVIGWAGVDGIHYCFVRGFGEMVFVVGPMSTPGNYVHPLAKDFKDFLRLLLACGHTAAVEQICCWEQAQFDAFLRDSALTAEQSAVLDIIQSKLSLAPMDQPFAYIKALQAGFDYSRIKYTEDYYEQVPAESKIPEWKVYFEGNFWGHHDRERAGKEISLNKHFVWDNEVWSIPAIYTCSKGLVVDFYLQVPAKRIRAFMDKWTLSSQNSKEPDFSDEQRMQIGTENPLAIRMNPKAALNGTALSDSHGCGISWNPCFPEGNSLEAKSVMQHYGLDPAQGYAIWRSAFSWKTKQKPQIKALSVTLMQEPVAIPGLHFHVTVPGERIEFTHPTTATTHTLIVQGYERQEISHEQFGDQNQELPTHYTMMSYTLSPDLPDGSFTVTDCTRSDRPRQKLTAPNEPQAISSVCVGVIGGTDGVTAIVFGGSNQDKLHAACSALHFEPVEEVEWRVVFYEKKREDVMVELI